MRILDALRAQPDAKIMVQGETEIKKGYRHWQMRTLVALFVGYALYYFVRKNLSVVAPILIRDLGFTKTEIGTIWSIHYLIYGFGKFGNGILSDRANPRFFMAIGLTLSALLNICFGFSSTLFAMTFIWAANGWVQAMGAPACARSLTHWFSKRELGTFWGIWNVSHQVGGAAILVLAGWLASHYGWRWAFFCPAIIALLGSLYLVNRLRDGPPSVGLPPVEVFRGEKLTKEIYKKVPLRSLLSDRALWFLAVGNFFVYIVRYGVMDWAPTFLVERRGSSVAGASLLTANFEIMGIFGGLLAGFLSDRLFKGRRGPLNVIYMLLLIFAIGVFWLNPIGRAWVDICGLGAMGFLVYGPQLLVGVAAADLVSKEAAGTATGFVGLGGYLGGIVSGVGAGMILDKFGWDGGFIFFIGCAIAGAICFMFTWKHRRGGITSPS